MMALLAIKGNGEVGHGLLAVKELEKENVQARNLVETRQLHRKNQG